MEVGAPGTQTTKGTGGRGVAEEGPGNPGTGVVGGGAQEPGGVVVQGPGNQGRSVGGGEASGSTDSNRRGFDLHVHVNTLR